MTDSPPPELSEPGGSAARPDTPEALARVHTRRAELGFSMSSSPETGRLLRSLAAGKPEGKVLELGTGVGAGTAWLLEGIGPRGSLVTVENDARNAEAAREIFSTDPRVRVITTDAAEYLRQASGQEFDLVFADTWAGKFHELDAALRLLAPGGMYVIDDLLPQPTWPPDHQGAVDALLRRLRAEPTLVTVELDWASGILIGTRRL